MPRKPKVQKHTLTELVNGVPITIHLNPPVGGRKSYYAYWNGLGTGKSTGKRTLAEAIVAAKHMVQNQTDRPTLKNAILSDEEFEAIQREHFSRLTDPRAKERAAKTFKNCLDAIDAFRRITGLSPITQASPDDCARFQRLALKYPKNWRQKHSNSREMAEKLSANTVLKWSRSLRAAFERVNANAGRKCVRGVVDQHKLLKANPWKEFTWIGEPESKPVRQFDSDELLSLLDFLEAEWDGVTVAVILAKVCLWSLCRREEVVALRWDALRQVGNEFHFEVVGKAGVEKWFRVPVALHQELLQVKTSSPFVFAAYNEQLRGHHEREGNIGPAKQINKEFRPATLGNWFYERLKKWSKSLSKGHATTHIFRKTGMQYARAGEDINRIVADDLRISPGVMMTSYVKETDEQLHAKSNRTFDRILASLPAEVAQRYGHVADGKENLEDRISVAIASGDWSVVARLAAERAKEQSATG